MQGDEPDASAKSQTNVKTSRRKLPPTLLLVLPAVRRIVGWLRDPAA
ncbi:hypothetical protein NKH98_22970 [Mesorhizobium sp. M0833]